MNHGRRDKQAATRCIASVAWRLIGWAVVKMTPPTPKIKPCARIPNLVGCIVTINGRAYQANARISASHRNEFSDQFLVCNYRIVVDHQHKICLLLQRKPDAGIIPTCVPFVLRQREQINRVGETSTERNYAAIARTIVNDEDPKVWIIYAKKRLYAQCC